MKKIYHHLFSICFFAPLIAIAGDFNDREIFERPIKKARTALGEKRILRQENLVDLNNLHKASQPQVPNFNKKMAVPNSGRRQKDLIQKSYWPKAAKRRDSSTFLSRKLLKNPYGASLLHGPEGDCYAIFPGKVLGRGKLGKVKPAQHIKSSNQSKHPEGTLVALKFQHEPFEAEEIEGLMLTSRLISSPIEYINKKHKERFVVAVKLALGITLWQWLEEVDPEQNVGLNELALLEKRIDQSLKEQVHKYSMAFQDTNSLENILIDPASGALDVVDFGNVIIFDQKAKSHQNFMLCSDDRIRQRVSIYEYLEAKPYAEELLDIYWIKLFFEAFEHITRFSGIEGIPKSAIALLNDYGVSWPPLFTGYFNKRDLKAMAEENDDKYILKYCSKLVF